MKRSISKLVIVWTVLSLAGCTRWVREGATEDDYVRDRDTCYELADRLVTSLQNLRLQAMAHQLRQQYFEDCMKSMWWHKE
jgi:hypothetical protein